MELPHAKRVHLQATLSPIELGRGRGGGEGIHDPGRPAVEIAAFLRTLAPRPDELRALQSVARSDRERQILDAWGASDPMALAAAIAQMSPSADSGSAARAARDPQEEAFKLLSELASHRFAAITAIETEIQEALAAAEKAWLEGEVDEHERSGGERIAGEPPHLERAQRLLAFVNPVERRELEDLVQRAAATPLGALITVLETRYDLEPLPRVPHGSDVGESELRIHIRKRLADRAAVSTRPRAERVTTMLSHPQVPATIKTALIGALTRLGVNPRSASFDNDWSLALQAKWAIEALVVAPEQSDVEGPAPNPAVLSPIGYLHLERLSYAPSGIEHGELVYSLPLGPGEEVSIVHKEWANTEEEFTKLVADQFEDYSERGVVDKTDMAEATSAQRAHSTSFSVAVSASGGFGPMTATVSSGFAAASADSSSRSSALNQSQTVTKKASARARKELRTSFRLAKKTHVEDQTVRRIKNPDQLHPVRYDFYQLLRRWRVDLHRYGVRLTYDLTIPQPAVELLAVYNELHALGNELDKGFEFDLPPGSITRANWRSRAEKYGVTLEPPPPLVIAVQTAKVIGPYPPEDPYSIHVDELRVSCPDGYAYQSHHANNRWYATPAPLFPPVHIVRFHGGKAPLPEIVFGVYLDVGTKGAIASVRVWFDLLPEAEEKWAQAAHTALREAANKAYLERRQMLEDRRTRILAQLAEVDTLTLRKLEREELMKGVLRWLFGPTFDFAPNLSGPMLAPDGSVASEGVQATMLQHGRIVSFLHQAIEWENINYFLYPYFWTKKTSWDLRLRLNHPDPIHEAFLRAGAARVVLTIRPGWERAFLTFLKTGSPTATLPSSHAYMTIAEEIENFAKTNYPGVVPANPAEVDPDEATEKAEGVLIGSWYEYTPTSALDIKIGETGPTEGTFVAPTFAPLNRWGQLESVRDAAVEVLLAAAKKLDPGP